jgi:hypothetical protein
MPRGKLHLPRGKLQLPRGKLQLTNVTNARRRSVMPTMMANFPLISLTHRQSAVLVAMTKPSESHWQRNSVSTEHVLRIERPPLPEKRED